MRERNESDLDQIIEDAIREEIHNSPVPKPMNEAWDELNQRLQNERNLRSRRSLSKKPVVAAACILFIMGSVALAPQVSAFGKLTEVFHKVSGSVVQLFGKVGDSNPPKEERNAPSVDEFAVVEGSKVTSQTMGLDEAQEVTAFQIRVPQRISPEFKLNNVTVIKPESKKGEEIYLHFDGKQREFTIREVKIADQFGFGEVNDEETKVEDVTINGQKGVVLKYKNGETRLVWLTTEFYFEIQGGITKEEAIQIANMI